MVNFNSIRTNSTNFNIDTNSSRVNSSKKNIRELSIDEIHQERQDLEKQKQAIAAYKKTCSDFKSQKLVKKQKHISFKI